MSISTIGDPRPVQLDPDTVAMNQAIMARLKAAERELWEDTRRLAEMENKGKAGYRKKEKGKMMDFNKAVLTARERAQDGNKQQFVYGAGDKFCVDSDFRNEWLFRVYPGGRAILSVRGVAVAEMNGYDVSKYRARQG